MVKVSIIMPVYNEGKLMRDAISSVINQTFKDWELIIVNDASTDSTLKIAREFEKKERRIRVVSHRKNKGRAAALNTGIKKARGKYIAFLDGDDIYLPEKTEKQVKFLEKHRDVDIVYGDMKVLNIDGKERIVRSIEFKENPKKILLESRKRKDLKEIKPSLLLSSDEKRFIPGCSVMLRKKVFNKIRFDENLKNSEDYDLWFQMIGKGFKFAKMNFVTYIYRQHQQQKSRDKEKMLKAARYINKKLKSGIYFK